jgi:hypothetical protein
VESIVSGISIQSDVSAVQDGLESLREGDRRSWRAPIAGNP